MALPKNHPGSELSIQPAINLQLTCNWPAIAINCLMVGDPQLVMIGYALY
jgi:hypothetical protein